MYMKTGGTVRYLKHSAIELFPDEFRGIGAYRSPSLEERSYRIIDDDNQSGMAMLESSFEA
jgi:hypothetical protein